MSTQDLHPMITRANRAKGRQRQWQSTLDRAFKYCLNSEEGFQNQQRGVMKGADVYDSTAPEAVDEWAARITFSLGLGFSQLVKLVPGPNVPEDQRNDKQILENLDRAHKTIYGHLMRSNLLSEVFPSLKQARVSTGALMFHEGETTNDPFRFMSTPLYQVVFDEGPYGTLQNFYRFFSNRLSVLKGYWSNGTWHPETIKAAEENPETVINVIDGTEFEKGDVGQSGSYIYRVIEEKTGHIVFQEKSPSTRCIAFRTDKDAGETLGRGAALRNLPDILSLNKMVELTLKNAAIAVTGIWQADDDGVLNPANIKLIPGSIIPKAVGSAGLTPLVAAGDFQISDHLIQDYRARIKRNVGGPSRKPMEAGIRSATEHMMDDKDIVILTMPENARLFREMIVPIYTRAAYILEKKGIIGKLGLENGDVEVQQSNPFKELLKRTEANDRMQGLQMASSFGAANISAVLKTLEATRSTLKNYGWPEDELNSLEDARATLKKMEEQAAAMAQQGGAPNAA